tara:strand:- start:66 stop:248 length:183 start_codon:yes stop_codon:yes gene_type:complete
MEKTKIKELKKQELNELLYILLDQKTSLWEFYSGNPNKISLDGKYDEVSKDIEEILNLLD